MSKPFQTKRIQASAARSKGRTLRGVKGSSGSRSNKGNVTQRHNEKESIAMEAHSRPVESRHPDKRTSAYNVNATQQSIETPFLYSRTRINFDKPPLYRTKADGGVPFDFQGLDDVSLYNGNKEGLDVKEWCLTLTFSFIQIPGAGSFLPHLYIPFVAHLFFRSVLIVLLMVLLWALLEMAIYWSIKRFSFPVRWPTNQAIDPDTGELYDYIDYERLYITTGLWNPLIGIIGMGLSWYSVRLFDLDTFTSEYTVGLVLFFVGFFFISVHQGINTSWLAMAFAAPVYILGFMAPIMHAYSRDFSEIAPYIFWFIVNVWFTLWFLRDPFARKGKKLFFSLDGTYAWNTFFSVTIYLIAVSGWKVIDLST